MAGQSVYTSIRYVIIKVSYRHNFTVLAMIAGWRAIACREMLKCVTTQGYRGTEESLVRTDVISKGKRDRQNER